MTITTTQADGITTLKVEGDLLIGGVADAKSAIIAALAAGGDIHLDLSEIGNSDTAGLQLLLMARASARTQGKRFETTSSSPTSFRAAVERAGIPVACFECQEGTR